MTQPIKRVTYRRRDGYPFMEIEFDGWPTAEVHLDANRYLSEDNPDRPELVPLGRDFHDLLDPITWDQRRKLTIRGATQDAAIVKLAKEWLEETNSGNYEVDKQVFP